MDYVEIRDIGLETKESASNFFNALWRRMNTEVKEALGEYAKKLNQLKIPGVVKHLPNPIAEIPCSLSETMIKDITDEWSDFVKISRNALIHGFSRKREDHKERKLDFRPHRQVKITIDQIYCKGVTISKNVAQCIFGSR